MEVFFGIVQILALLYRPLGDYMARIHTSSKT